MTKRLAFMLAVSLGACAGSETARVNYASVTVRSPDLVAVDDNLYVVADADEPVFYADDQYWLYRDNRWYGSRSYDRGFVHVNTPPQRVRRIQQPSAYIRYRTRNQEARRQTPRDPWRDEYDRRDAPSRLPREPQPLQPTQPAQPAQPYPRPPQQEPVEVRDHRTTPPVPHDPTRTMPRDTRPHPRDDDRDRDDDHDDDDDRDDRRRDRRD